MVWVHQVNRGIKSEENVRGFIDSPKEASTIPVPAQLAWTKSRGMQKHIACGNIDASVELVRVSRLRAAGLHFESKTMEGACEVKIKIKNFI